MLGSLGLPRDRLADVQVFYANSAAANIGWAKWKKRPGTSMVSVLCIAGGGGGGAGVIGANSLAAGGGGGASGVQTYVECMGYMLPDTLFISVGVGGAAATAGLVSRVAIAPDAVANNCLVTSPGGGAGGNAAGATAGAAGVGGSAQTIATMLLAGAGVFQSIGGQNGIIGGTTVAAAALPYPTSGLRVTGGTGGGGLPAAAAVGTAGGAITAVGALPGQLAAAGPATATVPATLGSNGYAILGQFGYWQGGTGGSSTHGTALTTGLVGGGGGSGGIGSGGGGGGGALTGSTAGSNGGGRGGDGIVIIASW